MISIEISPCVEFLLYHLGYGATGVEIGVENASNACAVFEHLRPTKYYLVDPWKSYDGYKTKHGQDKHDACYAQAVRNVAPYEAAHILRMTSEEASKVVPNDLDFVYVDGNHAYDYKMLDMELWYPKIRSGGIICGDDYNIENTHAVIRDFSVKYNLVFWAVAAQRGPHPLEFWSMKP